MKLRSNQQRNPRLGVTLVEIIVILFVAVALVVMLLPAVETSRRNAMKTARADQFRRLGRQVHSYHAVYQAFPPGPTVKSKQGEQ